MSEANKMRDISREQFEAWMHREYSWPLGLLSLAWDESTGTYKEASFHIGWTAWKASREAVVVSLPETHKPAPEDDERWHNVRNSTLGACRRAIEAQGLKVEVKP